MPTILWDREKGSTSFPTKDAALAAIANVLNDPRNLAEHYGAQAIHGGVDDVSPVDHRVDYRAFVVTGAGLRYRL